MCEDGDAETLAQWLAAHINNVKDEVRVLYGHATLLVSLLDGLGTTIEKFPFVYNTVSILGAFLTQRFLEMSTDRWQDLSGVEMGIFQALFIFCVN